MYTINEKNLKYAYSKLKKYAYYYTSSNYLKDKIIDFEDELTKNKDIFRKYANILNKIGENNYQHLYRYNFKCISYPKKDCFEMKKDEINVGSINVFIDMDFMFYLNDVLFCFELFDTYKDINEGYFYGNLFDKHLFRTENPLENNMLFDAYWPNYNKWKNSVTEKINNKVLKNSTLIKLDFQRCYYETQFRLDELLKKHNIDVNNPIVKIALNIYRYYSSQICKLTGQKKEENIVQLPLGLPSSAILQNIIFSKFDKKISNNSHVLSYARYVDDVLLLVDQDIENSHQINRIIEEINNEEDGNILINVNDEYLKPLKVNESKIEIRKGTSVSSLNEKIEKLVIPSMVEFMDEELSEISNEECFIDETYSQVYIKSIINKYYFNESNQEELKKFICSLKDIDLLNIYSCWNKILFIYRKDEIFIKELKDRIYNAINKIKYTNKDCFFKNGEICDLEIKKILIKDFEIAKKLSSENKYYLFNINQNDIFECISFAIENKEIYFPVYIKLEYIELYLSLKNKLNEDILNESKELYEKINNVKLNESHPANYTNITKIKDVDLKTIDNVDYVECEYSEMISFDLKKEIENVDKIKVGVMSVKMPYDKIENCDINCCYPKDYYSFNDLIKNIKTAKKNKASYIVMPEFCIPNKHLIKVLDCCIKNEISLVAGLTHFIESSQATNYIIIYDSIMKIALLKRKNYYPYEERIILANYSFVPNVDHKPLYIRINNSIIKYSTMTCYEATNIRDRAFLNDKINLLFLPVYNKDTNYFSDIIGSFSRDISSFVIQANNSDFGDSRISGPMDSYHKDIVKLKGGDNCYTVVGTIDLKKMKDKHSFMKTIENEIKNLVLSSDKQTVRDKLDNMISKNKKENEFKPLSAGSNLEKRKKYLDD